MTKFRFNKHNLKPQLQRLGMIVLMQPQMQTTQSQIAHAKTAQSWLDTAADANLRRKKQQQTKKSKGQEVAKVALE